MRLDLLTATRARLRHHNVLQGNIRRSVLSESNHHEGCEIAPGQLNEAFLGHALTPRNLGVLPKPQGFAAPQRSCGDYIELYLRIEDEVVQDARYMTEGCLQVVACGSALTSLIKGLPLDQAAKVGADEIEAELGGLNAEHRHCAELAGRTLTEAVRDYFRKRQAPWQGVFDKS